MEELWPFGSRIKSLTVARHQQSSGCPTVNWRPVSLRSCAAPPELGCAAAPWRPVAPECLSQISGWPDRQREAQTGGVTLQSPVYQTACSRPTPTFLGLSPCHSPRLQDRSLKLRGRVHSGPPGCPMRPSTSNHTDGGNGQKPAGCWQQLWLRLLCDEVFWDVSWNKRWHHLNDRGIISKTLNT